MSVCKQSWSTSCSLFCSSGSGLLYLWTPPTTIADWHAKLSTLQLWHWHHQPTRHWWFVRMLWRPCLGELAHLFHQHRKGLMSYTMHNSSLPPVHINFRWSCPLSKELSKCTSRFPTLTASLRLPTCMKPQVGCGARTNKNHGSSHFFTSGKPSPGFKNWPKS